MVKKSAIAGGHDRTIVYGDGSRLKAWPVVVGENALHRKTLEQAVGNHALGTAATFLGWLEDQLDGAGPVWVRRQQGRSPK